MFEVSVRKNLRDSQLRQFFRSFCLPLLLPLNEMGY